jgi:hypothetical protein
MKSPIPGIKTLLIGGTGSGKTHSLRTWVDAGITPMCIVMEPHAMRVLGDIPPDKLHAMYIKPSQGNLIGLKAIVGQIATMTYEQLTKVQDNSRMTNNRFEAILNALMDFKCDRTGKSFGNIGTWGTDRALCIDGLSGLVLASKSIAIGNKPTMSPSDYNTVQKPIENLINQLCTDYQFHFTLIAHAEREMDPTFGGSKLMASVPGKALAPVLPRFFSDVILAKRMGQKFYWDTADTQADLKATNCPINAELPPSFYPMVESWKKAGGIISPEV